VLLNVKKLTLGFWCCNFVVDIGLNNPKQTLHFTHQQAQALQSYHENFSRLFSRIGLIN